MLLYKTYSQTLQFMVDVRTLSLPAVQSLILLILEVLESSLVCHSLDSPLDLSLAEIATA